jgi:UDP-3-O-acyl N-acetylglucosamine deacetylase
MRKLGTRQQRTIAQTAEVTGIGFLTGKKVCLRFHPAGASSGVVFQRIDLPARLAAHVSVVTDTRRRTTLGCAPFQVTLVEHVLAALAGLRIDNCLVELDHVEPPGLDGSSAAFVDALLAAGIRSQQAERSIWAATEPITVRSGSATLSFHPPIDDDPLLHLSYFLDYGHFSPIARQVHTATLTPGGFHENLASCRTFLLASEADELKRQGLGSKTTPADLLVFGDQGPIDNSLRFADEPARHKVLDMIGDLSLLGADLAGHVVACRSGHPLNVELTKQLNERLVATRAVAA